MRKRASPGCSVLCPEPVRHKTPALGCRPETAIAENDTRVVSSCRLARVSKQDIPNPTLPAAPQPASTQLRRESRLIRIAKALASGATVTDIAEAEGIGRTLASRTANSLECRQLIADFVNAEHTEMRAMFYRSVRAVEHALSARREYLTKTGEILYGGPD